MEGLAALARLSEEHLTLAILVYVRILGTAIAMPGLGERSLSARVRGAVALMLAVALFPAVAARHGPVASDALAGLIVGEALIGLALGLMIRLIVIALQICGSIISQVSGLAQIMGFATVDPSPVVGHILTFAGLALLVMADVHIRVVVLLARTYDSFPVGAVLAPNDLAALAVARVADLFALAVALSAPFILMGLLYNLALGAINRAMPQLMVALVGAPAIILLTLALLAVSAPILLAVWYDRADAVIADPFGAN